MTPPRSYRLAASMAVLLVACGGGQSPGPAATGSGPTVTAATASTGTVTVTGGLPSGSSGQVSPAAAAPKVSYYAASRFAEQASFGPTPQLVAEIQAKGLEKWIDDQFALTFVPIDITPAEAIYAYGQNDEVPQALNQYADRLLARMTVSGTDQLRLRVMWSLSQFVVAAFSKGEPPGHLTWVNVLYRNAFGNYGQLLRDASVDRHMGTFLDNDQNRPKSAECTWCAPNENYARELMQLFSIGVVKLNPDGTPQKDSRGRFVETYSQKDVEELARVLTGWTTDPNPSGRPQRNWGNWGKPMVPSTWPPERDSGRKVVMGTAFPAGQSTAKDLDDAIAMLMAHPNIAPFVSTRLIQHLVKSDPSPAYVSRVAAVFRDNGRGSAGDMKAVVRAILLDPEARRGDTPSGLAAGDGKFREPVLHNTAVWRGLGCREVPMTGWGGVATASAQPMFRPDSVFSFYAPTDRAPGSNLLAPEQRLLTASEIRDRISRVEAPTTYVSTTGRRNFQTLVDAGCNVDEWRTAFTRSSRDFADLLSLRFFRGAMPPTLRSNIDQMMRETYPPWTRDDPVEGTLRMIGFALATPYFGVMK